jgi:hypothetical protein
VVEGSAGAANQGTAEVAMVEGKKSRARPRPSQDGGRLLEQVVIASIAPSGFDLVHDAESTARHALCFDAGAMLFKTLG